MRIVFCGTPQFAVPSLKFLLTQKEIEIVSVFTQPDRPRGRGQDVSFSPVKEVAVAAELEVMQPEKVRELQVESYLRYVLPDAIVIIAYGQIIPGRLLPIPRLGWINLHASLLPKSAAEVSRGGADSVGDCRRRDGDGKHDNAD